MYFIILIWTDNAVTEKSFCLYEYVFLIHNVQKQPQSREKKVSK